MANTNSTGGIFSFSDSTVIADMIVSPIITLSALIGNSLVLYITFLHRRRSRILFYIGSMALSDFIYSLTIPFYFFRTNVTNWIFGKALCIYPTWVSGGMISVSSITMVTIAIDRH